MLRISPIQVVHTDVREGGANPPRARRCNRGRKPQEPLSCQEGKARLVERAGSQKTCLRSNYSFDLCAVQSGLNLPEMKNGIHGSVNGPWFFFKGYGSLKHGQDYSHYRRKQEREKRTRPENCRIYFRHPNVYCDLPLPR